MALDDLRLRHQIGAALAVEPGGGDRPPSPSTQTGGSLGAPNELGGQMAAEVEAALAAESGFDLHRVLLMAIEAALRGGASIAWCSRWVIATRHEVSGKPSHETSPVLPYQVSGGK